MPASADEVAEVRAHYVNEAGKGQLVETALAERANLLAYGGDTSGPDKRLAELGWQPADERARAAEKRAAAAADEAEADDRPARGRPPAGRTRPLEKIITRPDKDPAGNQVDAGRRAKMVISEERDIVLTTSDNRQDANVFGKPARIVPPEGG
jgi:hypothetical protein